MQDRKRLKGLQPSCFQHPMDRSLLRTIKGVYNKSLGGALVDPDLNALELTEIAGLDNNIFHSLKSSLIVNGNKKISFKGDLVSTVVGYDNLSINKDENLKEVTISVSDKKVSIVYSKNNSYIKKIRKSFVL